MPAHYLLTYYGTRTYIVNSSISNPLLPPLSVHTKIYRQPYKSFATRLEQHSHSNFMSIPWYRTGQESTVWREAKRNRNNCNIILQYTWLRTVESCITHRVQRTSVHGPKRNDVKSAASVRLLTHRHTWLLFTWLLRVSYSYTISQEYTMSASGGRKAISLLAQLSRSLAQQFRHVPDTASRNCAAAGSSAASRHFSALAEPVTEGALEMPHYPLDWLRWHLPHHL